jgi:acyl carrier protein
MYRTGDLVRCADNHLLEFKGRVDDQVKLHGIRIQLGEIDSILLRHPHVREASTVLRPVGTEESRLVAFVVLKTGRTATVETIRTFLLTILPEAIVPSLVVFVAELPWTATGKIDRQELIRVDISPGQPRSAMIAPRTPIECLVAQCWEESLQLKGIGIEDDFFALGGDSLQAIQMTIQLQKLLPVRLPLGTLFFQDPTLKAFAATIEAKLINLHC